MRGVDTAQTGLLYVGEWRFSWAEVPDAGRWLPPLRCVSQPPRYAAGAHRLAREGGGGRVPLRAAARGDGADVDRPGFGNRERTHPPPPARAHRQQPEPARTLGEHPQDGGRSHHRQVGSSVNHIISPRYVTMRCGVPTCHPFSQTGIDGPARTVPGPRDHAPVLAFFRARRYGRPGWGDPCYASEHDQWALSSCHHIFGTWPSSPQHLMGFRASPDRIWPSRLWGRKETH